MKKITVPVEIEVPDGYEFERCYDAKMSSQALDGSYMEKILNIRFKKIEPKKVIDLSCIVGSGIDCEFSDDRQNWSAGKLKSISDAYCIEEKNVAWRYCRIRQSPHVNWWNRESSCPLPNGLRLKLYLIDKHGDIVSITTNDYCYFHLNKVVGFEILGPAEGWRYEWEEEYEKR